MQIKTEFKEMIHKNLKVTKSFMGIPYKKDDIMKQEVIFFTVNDEIKSYRLKKYNFKDLLITIDFVIEFDVKKYIFEYRGIMQFLSELGGIVSICLSSVKAFLPYCALLFFISLQDFLKRRSQQRLRLMQIKDILKAMP